MYNALLKMSYLWDLLEQKNWGRFYSHNMGVASYKENLLTIFAQRRQQRH